MYLIKLGNAKLRTQTTKSIDFFQLVSLKTFGAAGIELTVLAALQT